MIKALLLTGFLSSSVFGQGSIQFLITLDSSKAIPPNSNLRTGSGEFSLAADGLFSGWVFIDSFPIDYDVAVFKSNSADLLGTELYSFTPGGVVFPDPGNGDFGGQQHTFERTLTSTEINDLLAGNWWINASTSEFPTGELRGQIVAVPEPSSICLLGFLLGIRIFSTKKCAKVNT